MKKFIVQILLFSLPLFLLALPAFIILVGSGAYFQSLDSILKSDEKYLIGFAYNEKNYNYIKWKEIESSPKNDILSIGSSRVLAFRDEMFKTSFYNAGYTITSMTDYLLFFKNIPKTKYPKVLIMGIDQWMFNASYDDYEPIKSKTYWEDSFTYFPTFKTIKTIYIDLLKDKYDLSVVDNEDRLDKIGLNALVYNTGLRNDGSMYYGRQIKNLINNSQKTTDFNYEDTFLRIKKGNRRFEYADHSNKNTFAQLDEFLGFCKENNIYVIGFLPPYANAVYQKMVMTNKYNYLKEIYPKGKVNFSKYNFELYDFTDGSKFGATDDETIDGFHGGELTYIKMLLKMTKNNSVINKYVNSDKLQLDIKNRLNNYTVYDY